MTAFPFRSCWAPHLRHVALGPVFSFALSALKSAIREGQQRKWHPDFTPRDILKQLLLYGCLPWRMVRLTGLVAGFKVRRSVRPAKRIHPQGQRFRPHGPAAGPLWFQAMGTRRRVPLPLQDAGFSMAAASG